MLFRSKKGSSAYFEGKLQTRKWQDKDGNDRYTTEIVANEMQMIGGRDDRPQDMQSQPAAPQERPAAPQPDDGFDDIPFADPYKFIRLVV